MAQSELESHINYHFARQDAAHAIIHLDLSEDIHRDELGRIKDVDVAHAMALSSDDSRSQAALLHTIMSELTTAMLGLPDKEFGELRFRLEPVLRDALLFTQQAEDKEAHVLAQALEDKTEGIYAARVGAKRDARFTAELSKFRAELAAAMHVDMSAMLPLPEVAQLKDEYADYVEAMYTNEDEDLRAPDLARWLAYGNIQPVVAEADDEQRAGHLLQYTQEFSHRFGQDADPVEALHQLQRLVDNGDIDEDEYELVDGRIRVSLTPDNQDWTILVDIEKTNRAYTEEDFDAYDEITDVRHARIVRVEVLMGEKPDEATETLVSQPIHDAQPVGEESTNALQRLYRKVKQSLGF